MSGPARLRIAMALIALTAGVAGSQEPLPFSLDRPAAFPRGELDAITARGTLLARYDFASWHATDAVMAIQPRAGLIEGYLARPRADGRWEVVFGRLRAAGADTFRVAFRAVQKEPQSTAFTTYEMRPPSADTGYFARAARALYICRADFPPVNRPYNAMVVPVGGGDEWYVYLVPAPTASGAWPHGGDVRYRVSPDGRTIVERRRMHNAIIEYPPPAERAGAKLVFSYHTAVLDDRPEDTDVFHVLTRQPRMREIVVTRSFAFVIDTTGHIAAYVRDSTKRERP